MKCAAAPPFYILSLSFSHSPHFPLPAVVCISGGAQNVMPPAAARFFMHKITSLLPKESGRGAHAQGDARQANTRKIEINYLCALSAWSQMDFSFCVTKHQSLA